MAVAMLVAAPARATGFGDILGTFLTFLAFSLGFMPVLYGASFAALHGLGLPSFGHDPRLELVVGLGVLAFVLLAVCAATASTWKEVRDPA